MSNPASETVVAVSQHGQATTPKEFRDELGIDTLGWVKFIQTEEGDIVVRPIESVTDLRGMLDGNTDEQGRSATERLHDARSADKASDAALRQRYAGDDDGDT